MQMHGVGEPSREPNRETQPQRLFPLLLEVRTTYQVQVVPRYEQDLNQLSEKRRIQAYRLLLCLSVSFQQQQQCRQV